jgi:hypothetical protein
MWTDSSASPTLVADLGPGEPSLLEAEGHVLGDRHVGPEGVALEHHPRVALVGRQLRHVLVPEEDPPLVGDVEAGQAPEQRRLAAPARAQEEKELPGLDPQVEVAQRRDGAEAFGQVLDSDRYHSSLVGRVSTHGRPESKSKEKSQGITAEGP